VVIDASQQAGPLMEEISGVGGKLLESCDIFDIYQGEQIGKNKKSVAFSLTFRAEDRTLVDDEVNKIFDKIVKKLESEYSAELRK
jgi:phenylalanyl-tRNA synthetase beta chain